MTTKTFTHAGLTCTIILMQHMPTLTYYCGYVDIPRDHPLFGVDLSMDSHGIEAHGGVTYAAPEGENLWRVGFDCAHWRDCTNPSDPRFPAIETIEGYCCDLADSLMLYTPPKPLKETLAQTLWQHLRALSQDNTTDAIPDHLVGPLHDMAQAAIDHMEAHNG